MPTTTSVAQDRWASTLALYSGKVRTFARNSFRQIPDHDQSDMEQELLLVLWDCVEHYDPNKGASFNTFFQQSAKNRIITLIRRYSAKSRTATCVSLGDDAVALAVEEYLSVHSAEELALWQMEIKSIVAEHGQEIFSGNRRRRPIERVA